ncbi:hypothetical protein [Arhodomonas sp. AD133]|uniref:hypothetical protein n=1 Tax=Arhodomonas sp. AD133 TaxID=3415009 RepID=UPI003EBC1734
MINMEFDAAQDAFRAGELTEAVVSSDDERNGWVIMVRRRGAGLEPITDTRGEPRVYHQLDHASELARRIGFRQVRIEEPF